VIPALGHNQLAIDVIKVKMARELIRACGPTGRHGPASEQAVRQALGVPPSVVARTARVQRAKRLLDDTEPPMLEIALRSGFGSLRRFNAVFSEDYKRPPSDIRADETPSEPRQ
jgi:methylphosphotriester-DNA--protein-cysteine methyltransferase